MSAPNQATRTRTAVRVLATVAFAVFAFGVLLLGQPGARGGAARRAGTGVVFALTQSAAPVVRPRQPQLAPAGAVAAARAFVTDYLVALTNVHAAAHVRNATTGLRERIAAAGVLLSAGAGAPTIHTLTAQPRTRSLVAVHADAAVADVAQHLQFVMARTPSGWRVADLADPEAP